MKVAVRSSYESPIEAKPDVAVFFDVFRASTTLAALLSRGVAEILTTADPALLAERRQAGYRLVSEVHEGGLDNSPTQVLAQIAPGERIVHKSTNLTQAIFRNTGFRTGLIGCFANAAALLQVIRSLKPGTVELIAAGHVDRSEPAIEDTAAAHYIAAVLAGRAPVFDRSAIAEGIDEARVKDALSPHYRRDTELALTIDRLPWVGRIEDSSAGWLEIRAFDA